MSEPLGSILCPNLRPTPRVLFLYFSSLDLLTECGFVPADGT
jgi:hypothetical protein